LLLSGCATTPKPESYYDSSGPQSAEENLTLKGYSSTKKFIPVDQLIFSLGVQHYNILNIHNPLQSYHYWGIFYNSGNTTIATDFPLFYYNPIKNFIANEYSWEGYQSAGIPGEYGFDELEFSDPRLLLTKVHIPYSIELKSIAAMADISLSELKRYNPELRSWCTPPGRGGYWVKIPESKKENFAKNFSKNKEKLEKLQAGQKHRITPGETLTAIARQYTTSVNQLIQLNGITNPRRLRPGQTLRIPTS